MKHGRKFFLSALFMVQGWVLLGLSYVLALNDKLSSEWVQLLTIWLPMAATVTGVFAATNAYVSGKALSNGAPPNPEAGA